MALAATLVGWIAGGRLFQWSRGRCDEALAAARHLALPSKRSFLRLATDRPPSRARVRLAPTPQQAFENTGRDGALLARRTVSASSQPAD
jgi:hypothetical protein